MPDATVNLYDAGTGNQLQSTVTNSNGFYTFTVDNGNYNLLIDLLQEADLMRQ